MPLYEYKCEKCGKIKEVIQNFSDLPLTKCSDCYGKMYKIISKNSFHLKGSGWYVTDYQNSPKKTNNTNTSEACSNKISKEQVNKTSAKSTID